MIVEYGPVGSTEARPETGHLRNIAILGAPDAGKTTLVERSVRKPHYIGWRFRYHSGKNVTAPYWKRGAGC